MAQEKPRKNHRLLGALGRILLALLLMAAVYLAAVLLEAPGEEKDSFVVQEDAPAVTRMQSAVMDDAAALAQMFGAPLPSLPGLTPRGEAGNSEYDGSPARVATLKYEGLTVSAVQPAAAAPLLRRGELEVSFQSSLTVLGLPAMLAEKEEQRCLYFSSEGAAYAVYSPNASQEDFLSLIALLQWTR